MTWYEDPTGTAAKVTAAAGALVTLAVAVGTAMDIDIDNDALQAIVVAAGPVILTVLSLLAIFRARQDAYAPGTVVELVGDTAEAERNKVKVALDTANRRAEESFELGRRTGAGEVS